MPITDQPKSSIWKWSTRFWRYFPACRISWDLLPSELLERSFKQTSNVQMLLSLRLVSKAWKAAAPKAFPGCLRVKIQAADHGATKLANVCKSLPNTTSLELQSRHTFFDVSPISKFSKLSSLVLKHWSDKGSGYHLLDLAILPSSLRDLQIEHWTFDITTLQGFISIDITSLHLSKTRSRLADTYELLQHLPGLKVKNSLPSKLLRVSWSYRSTSSGLKSLPSWLYVKNSSAAANPRLALLLCYIASVNANQKRFIHKDTNVQAALIDYLLLSGAEPGRGGWMASSLRGYFQVQASSDLHLRLSKTSAPRLSTRGCLKWSLRVFRI